MYAEYHAQAVPAKQATQIKIVQTEDTNTLLSARFAVFISDRFSI
jgi:hypothetical protein